MDAKEISNRLRDRCLSVCEHLLPGGKKEAGEYVFDPGHGKIKVRLSGAKLGLFAHWGAEESEHAKGDLLELWAYSRACTISQAIKEAADFLGIERPQFQGQRPKSYKRPDPKRYKLRPATPGTKVDAYLRGERGLTAETIKAYRIMEAEAWVRGDKTIKGPWIAFPYLRRHDGRLETTNIKWIHVERTPDGKKRVIQEAEAEPGLFGWHLVPDDARVVCITEGEIDAMTVRQWGLMPVLSVPAGAGVGGKHQWIENDYDRLLAFDEIFICMDMDPEGDAATADIVRRLGLHRCRIVRLPHKDANECHAEYGMTATEAAKWFEQAQFLEPQELKGAGAFTEEVIEAFYPTDKGAIGIALPWTKAKDLRLRMGELSIWLGVNGHGKALDVNTPILTELGWTPMVSIEVGDRVFDDRGDLCNVVATSPIMYGRRCFEVEFSDGSKIIADAEHEWLTRTQLAARSERNAQKNEELRPMRKWRGPDQSDKRTFPSLITTEQIANTLIHENPNGQILNNHAIQVCGPLELPELELPIEPYVLGAWLGDGTSSSASIAAGKDAPEILREIRQAGYLIRNRKAEYQYGIGGGLQKQLREAGLLNKKRVPEEYFRSSLRQRLSLVQGLMDTDGHITKYGRCEFTTVRKNLAKSFYDLVTSLGIIAKIIEGRAKLKGRDCGPKYRVTFTSTVPVFRLRRKLKHIKRRVSDRALYRFIISCRPIDSVPVRCIQVDAPSKLFAAGFALIPTHNSSLMGQVVLHGVVDERACIASFEVKAAETLKLYTQKLSRSPAPSVEMIRACQDWMDGRIWLYDRTGKADRARLIEVFTYARRRYGIRLFVIDSLMRCGIAEDDYNTQGDFVDSLVDWALAEGAHVCLIAHPTKPKDEKTPISRLDMRGAGKMTDLAHICCVFWRNIPKERRIDQIKESDKHSDLDRAAKLEDQRKKADNYLIVEKQRAGTRWTGTVRLWRDPESDSWSDWPGSAPPKIETAPQDDRELAF